jgi:uncharacterized membrane protein
MTYARTGPTPLPGLLLGLGLGGLADGIVLHQLLGWHHLLSGDRSPTSLAGLEANVVADGVFHAGTWLLVLAGTLTMLAAWRSGRAPTSWTSHIGLLLAGWGAFNLVEGLIDHQILGIHHVRPGDAQWAYDLGYLAFGLGLVVAGARLARGTATQGAGAPGSRGG